MIHVDTVYQTVQALANKEQRGYLTPQEFNLFVNQAQHDIFEQYFYDLNAVRAQRPEGHQLGDSVSHIMEMIRAVQAANYNIVDVVLGRTLPQAGRIGRIFLNQGTIGRRELKPMEMDQIRDLLSSKWHQKGFSEAVFFDDGDRLIQVWDGNGAITNGVECEVVTGRPSLAVWGYTIINEKAVFNPATSQHIDLHPAEQPDVVFKVLKLAGISIEDPSLYQVGSQEDSQNTQQESK